jgi:DNA-binding CsgD family transcriptional regulator
MSSEALRAAFRVLCKLGVRTVYGRADHHNGNPGRRTIEHARELNGKIGDLHAKGLSRKEIKAELGVSVATVGKHLNGKIKVLR